MNSFNRRTSNVSLPPSLRWGDGTGAYSAALIAAAAFGWKMQ